MSKEDTAQLILLLAAALAVLVVIIWLSHYLGKREQERANGIFGKYGTPRRKVLRFFAYVVGPLVSVAIAYGGYQASAPIAISFGFFGLVCIGVHRLAYELGKKAGTDPDPHYE